jgi:hypothetical protein
MHEISIVVPTYNEAVHIDEALRAMTKSFSEAGIDFGLRVVNNGSTNSTDAPPEGSMLRHPGRRRLQPGRRRRCDHASW